MIVGIDEVGRGPWAGPLVFGAVVLGDHTIEGLTDSKKLSKKRREELAKQIYEQADAVSLGWVSAHEVDSLGLSQALTLGCQRALEQIHAPYSQIILDGTVNLLKATGKGPYVTTMAKADLLVPSVSAASIVAKVARDDFMTKQDDIYPGYNFGSHSGYGTAKHVQAIDQLGVTPLHRLSFAPLTKYSESFQEINKSTMISPTTIGQRGEDAAANYLTSKGFTVVERNWKTKACEIDIVAKKDYIFYFVEVKYRGSSTQGGGIAAITPTKLKQMNRAVRFWFQKYGDSNAKLSCIEVTGTDFEVTSFVEQV